MTSYAQKMQDAEKARKELNARMRKHKITARKHNGDDQYSWTVFRDGREYVGGLGRNEVDYYKKMCLDQAEKKG